MYLFLFSTLGLYWLCLWFLLQGRQPVGVDPSLIRTILAVLAIMDGAIALYWFFFRLKPLLDGTSSQVGELFPRLRANYAICWVISEAIAVYGVASAFLTATIADYTPYFLASAAMLALCYPRTPQTAAGGPIG